MNNILNAIQVLQACEAVINSTLVTDGDERTLLSLLVNQLPLRDHLEHEFIIANAISRYNARERTGPYKAQGRPTEGLQEQAEVAQEGNEATEGETSGSEEQAEDAGSIPDTGDGGGTPTETEAPSETTVPKRQPGKAPRK